MKKNLLLLFLSVLTINSFAQKLDWAKILVGTYSGGGASAIPIDSGNLIVVGSFMGGTMDVDPDTTVRNIIAGNVSSSQFIAKFDTGGHYKWVKTIATSTGSFFSGGFAYDHFGNTYFSGQFYGTVGFAGVTCYSANSSLYILKLNASGNIVWLYIMPDATETSYAYGITTDARGNVYTVGEFTGTRDFNFGTGADSLNSAQGNFFLLKMDSAGSFIWAKNMCVNLRYQMSPLTIDAGGNICFGGTIDDSCDIDPGPAVYNFGSPDLGSEAAFISKLDSSGNFLLAKVIPAHQRIYKLVAHDDNNLYAKAFINGNNSYSILKLTTNADTVWARTSDGGYDWTDFCLDSTAHVYTTGGGDTMHVVKLDSNGNTIWNHSFASYNTYSNFGTGINIDADDNIYLAGRLYGVIDFDPGADSYSLNSTPNYTNLFFMKWNQCSVPVGVSADICTGDSYSFNGQQLTVGGIYKDMISLPGECDSIITLTLNVNPTPTALFVVYPDSTSQGIYYGYNQSTGTNLSYVWQFGDGYSSNLQYPSHTYSVPGQYYLCLTVNDSTGCSDTHCDSSFYVFKTEGGLMSQLNIVDPNAPIGIKEIKANFKVSVYPNPATNLLNINLGGIQAEQVSIYNVDGKLVSETKQPANNAIDISSLATGVYVAEVKVSGAVQRVRWVKM